MYRIILYKGNAQFVITLLSRINIWCYFHTYRIISQDRLNFDAKIQSIIKALFIFLP